MDTERIQKQLCQKCWNRFVFAGQAFTTTHCKECGKEMTFATTDTDRYCSVCALEKGICKHCGEEMD